MKDDQEPQEAEHGPMGEWPTGRLLVTAARLVEHAWLDGLAEHGLSHAGLIALHLLGEEPTNQTDLAERARVENQTMSRTLDRLERDLFPAISDPAALRSALLDLIAAGTARRWNA
jgi:DNA-binding MarR family transcriptional regulator